MPPCDRVGDVVGDPVGLVERGREPCRDDLAAALRWPRSGADAGISIRGRPLRSSDPAADAATALAAARIRPVQRKLVISGIAATPSARPGEVLAEPRQVARRRTAPAIDRLVGITDRGDRMTSPRTTGSAAPAARRRCPGTRRARPGRTARARSRRPLAQSRRSRRQARPGRRSR